MTLFSAGHAQPSKWVTYPYRGDDFEGWVQESFKVVGGGTSADFYSHMDKEILAAQGVNVDQWIAREKEMLRQGKGSVASHLTAATDSWTFIKKTIRVFSLTRGFEFSHTVNHGERQCFLQSVLIAGLLHRLDIPAGVVMVWKNPKGDDSNLAHACNLVAIDGRQSILIDASDPQPMNNHQGIFLGVNGKYTFVSPQYSGNVITSFVAEGTGKAHMLNEMQPLSKSYIKSMFNYYRGERVPNGILTAKPEPAALQDSIRFFQQSVKDDAQNPLATVMLGRALNKAGDVAQARSAMEKARALYSAAGWAPTETAKEIDTILGTKSL